MRLTEVGKRYGARGPWVLRSVRLDLPPASLTRVDGANGSGKSTLLKVVAGVCVPTTGRVHGRRRAAYVPDRFPASLPFTVTGYLIHLGRVHGLSGRESARRADHWIERFDATAWAATSLRELSKGSCQKVAVIQALLAEPDLLVLDEAWTGLDIAARRVLDQAVGERVAAGGTVVFADHDPRRLAGALTAAYRIADGTLSVAATPAVAAPMMLIEVADVSAEQLAELADAGSEPARRTGAGRFRLRASARDSDALLRRLLTAHPAAHVLRVWPEDAPSATRGAAAAGDAADAAGGSTGKEPR